MLSGKLVIATDYSGSAEVCRPGTAMLVRSRKVKIKPGEYLPAATGLMWAEPSIPHAAQLMRLAYDDAKMRRAVSLRARDLVKAEYGRAATTKRLAALLSEIGMQAQKPVVGKRAAKKKPRQAGSRAPSRAR
jgi:hypothetical protein